MKNILKIIALAFLLGAVVLGCISKREHNRIVADLESRILPLDTVYLPGKPILIVDTLPQEDNSFLYDLILNQKDEDCKLAVKSAIDSTISWYKKHPLKIEYKTTITDTKIIPDPEAEKRGRAIGFIQGQQSVKPIIETKHVGTWWIWAFFIELFLSLALIIGYIVGSRKK